ncbi:MAG: hypothetical protein ACREM8_00295 [Vulcanimicrobiaceae bacterium]
MPTPAQARLLAQALTLPVATTRDFAGDRRPPADVAADHLRIIADTALRTRFIEAGLAEGLQSPKGPQKIKSIVRIYPEFDSPRPAHRSPVVSNGKPAQRARKTVGHLATVEELETLLGRIRQVETEVAREMRASVDAEIDRLKRTMALLSGIELEEAHRKLGEALTRRRELAWQIRLEAFSRIAADESFSPRTFLRFFAR